MQASWRQSHIGTLVLDRKVVVPGDTLHVQGYVQEQTEAGVLLRGYCLSECIFACDPIK